ncbi:MAG: 6-O-methylguanine DNA methyltransferase [Candidatus Yanofskybacteria bacterium RIFCSPHIGHO2_02_FULL_43_15c]|uniref:methylated-DNA--[protein]-cysteine S-methyltransferase n=2 Tax=Candidatus Yanofskyibacteriota TaxID=1752733 RepID=A0A1F8H657_9BACT|nr:MAG: 6-O-methylguanine DNA methyltransferase [Candidatus Yanofskybacteria bacterium RIFCSPHIGHO2_02_FULL_43_15c]OGN32720.1 MAG: 6-O-methylguanine DNA methyltransferase [Candidatus Yanofskybacteria bacterium RIFCSPLOWO2_02_FULL_43_10b]
MTKFQEKVYKAVSKIPKGETRSYVQIAKAIGHPKAYRAVGNALNKNLFLGVVPCHRVVRSNGQPGGYVLGTKKKIQLLQAEEAE